MDLSRRGFIKITGAGLAASSLGALGFGFAGEALAASVRPYKLTAASETRNTCTYCSVACGILIYSLGDRAKNAVSDIIHIEGDPDHPVNRGTLCPKGSALLDIVHAPTRLKVPKYRAPGANEFKEVSWDFALDRIATLARPVVWLLSVSVNVVVTLFGADPRQGRQAMTEQEVREALTGNLCRCTGYQNIVKAVEQAAATIGAEAAAPVPEPVAS